MSLRRLRTRAPGWLLRAVVALLYLFMLGPIAITAATSFTAGNFSRFPPEGLSLRWWKRALAPDWLDPLLFTLQLGAIVAALSLVLGTMLAFGMARYPFRGRDLIGTMTFGPIILPHLVIGIALLQALVSLGFTGLVGMVGLVIGHLVICVPYVVRTVLVSLQAMPRNVELAAMNLGASRGTVLRTITLPLIKSGVFAGVVFAFIHSFNDINVALFLSTPTERVINIRILGQLNSGFEPVIAAVAIMTLIVPMVLVYFAERFFGIGDFIYGARRD